MKHFRTISLVVAIVGLTTPARADVVREIERRFPSMTEKLAPVSDFIPARKTVRSGELTGVRAKQIALAPAALRGLQPAEAQALQAVAARATAGQTDGLQLLYPNFYDQPFLAELGDQRVVLRAVGARGGAATIERGRITYAGIYDDVDSVHVATEGRSEEFLLLRSKAAPLLYEYEIVEMSGVSEVVLRDGAIHFLRSAEQTSAASSRPALMIERPWLIDADGTRSETAVRWELAGDARIRLHVAAGTLRYPLLVDPTFTTTASMGSARGQHTATLLSNGKVLVTGGYNGSAVTNTAELYDPATNAFTATGSMGTARRSHTATVLPNGKVLVSGGETGSATTNSAELYDPASGTFTATGSMATARHSYTSTLLPNGKVLVSGGHTGSAVTITAELYDAASGTFTATGSMATGRTSHTATLLPNGKILISGGDSGSAALSAAELYDPAGGIFTTTGSMATARREQTATLLPNGKVLVTGGFTGTAIANTAELYDPASGTFTATGSMGTSRHQHAATLLPNGKLLVSGGYSATATTTSTAELYDPASGTFTATVSLGTARRFHTATMLTTGRVLVSGGHTGATATNTSELYDSANGTFTVIGSMVMARYNNAATLLPNGKVLLSGGDSASVTNSAELYDPVTRTFTATASMVRTRSQHTATLLPNGKVLVVGGHTGQTPSRSAELYDPASGTFTSTGNLATSRYRHTATLLPNGKVLISGGGTANPFNVAATMPVDSAELYDPATGTFAPTGGMAIVRQSHTATLLTNGKVLVSGGWTRPDGATATAELYDPASGTFTATGNMTMRRMQFTSTLLPNGKVLVTGGDGENYSDTGQAYTAELYDPASGTFTATGRMTTGRRYHTATLLHDKVLVTGGSSGSAYPTAVELYDPATGTFTAVAALTNGRSAHTATLLLNGTVLVTSNSSPGVPELYDAGLGFADSRRPVISTITSEVVQPAHINVTGTGLTGDSEASGGSANNSATNHAILQLRRVDNDQTTFVALSSWSATALQSNSLTDMPYGYYRATVFVNGVPSQQQLIKIVSPNRAPVLAIGNKGVNEGATLSFNANAVDADGDPITYGASNLPSGATFNSATGAFSWTPTYSQSGSYSVTFTAADNTGTASETITITVANMNRNPILAAIGNKSVAENASLTFTIAATDADGETLTYGATNLPAGATLNGSTGAFSWTPTYSQSGAYNVTFTAADGNNGTASEAITISVTNTNRSPVLGAIGNKSVFETASLTFTVAATEPEGEALTYGASGLPSGATFNSSTGAFSWTPNYSQSGTYQVTFHASDASGGSAFETITITVMNVNRDPVLAAIGNKLVAANATLTFTATATDPDGQTLSYSMNNAPVGATIHATSGAFSWTPAFNQQGTHSGIIIIVSDPSGGTDSRTITITVTNGVVSRKAPNDFNGDALTDLVWRHSSGTLALWEMQTRNITNGATFGSVLPSNWQIQGYGDFAGDGKWDIVLRNSNDGMIAFWDMDGHTVTNGAAVATVPMTWKIELIGDFNGDGRSDIILRNQITTEVAMWEMNGRTITNGAAFINLPLEWRFATAGDFNNDTRDDIIVRNSSSGLVALWEMNGRTLTNGAAIMDVPTSWQIVPATGDFNGDGYADLIWRHTDGTIAMWEMQGRTITNGAAFGWLPAEWQIRSAGHFDADAKSDLYLYNSSTGLTALWQMNGHTMTNGAAITPVPLEWSPQTP